MTLALNIHPHRSAASAGRAVTVSKSNISFHGWSGCGYVITNPATGDGAYMISGGENGGLVFSGIGTWNCQQSWAQCYTNCIDTLVPINPWKVIANATLVGNILYFLGGGVLSITINGEIIVIASSALWFEIPIALTMSYVIYGVGQGYLAWVAGTSIGCMISCGANQCNY